MANKQKISMKWTILSNDSVNPIIIQLNLTSGTHMFLKVLVVAFFKQWAAVKTWPGEINVPPQNPPCLLTSWTWKGYASESQENTVL